MIRLVFFTLLLLTVVELRAQNLVPNPSFEEYVDCPAGPTYFLEDFNNNVSYWFIPNYNTPDFFHSCAPYDIFGTSVPANFFGNQLPRTGNGYAGQHFFTLSGAREYISAKLKIGVTTSLNISNGLLKTTETNSNVFSQQIYMGYSYGFVIAIHLNEYQRITPTIMWVTSGVSFKIDPSRDVDPHPESTTSTSFRSAYGSGEWTIILPYSHRYAIKRIKTYSSLGVGIGRTYSSYYDRFGLVSQDTNFIAIGSFEHKIENGVRSFFLLEQGVSIDRKIGELNVALAYNRALNERMFIEANYQFLNGKQYRATINSSNSFLALRTVFYPHFRKRSL